MESRVWYPPKFLGNNWSWEVQGYNLDKDPTSVPQGHELHSLGQIVSHSNTFFLKYGMYKQSQYFNLHLVMTE